MYRQWLRYTFFHPGLRLSSESPPPFQCNSATPGPHVCPSIHPVYYYLNPYTPLVIYPVLSGVFWHSAAVGLTKFGRHRHAISANTHVHNQGTNTLPPQLPPLQWGREKLQREGMGKEKWGGRRSGAETEGRERKKELREVRQRAVMCPSPDWETVLLVSQPHHPSRRANSAALHPAPRSAAPFLPSPLCTDHNLHGYTHCLFPHSSNQNYIHMPNSSVWLKRTTQKTIYNALQYKGCIQLLTKEFIQTQPMSLQL